MVPRTGRWLIAILAPIVLVLSGCSKSTPQAAPTSPAAGSSSAGQQDVAVTLNQWAIVPTSVTVPAGAITFSVSNVGTIPHEFVVLSTETAAADFPVTSFEGETNRFDEDAAGENVGETGDMDPATTQSLTIDLQPGHYAFVCNLPGHYASGMHIDFTVTS